jgi:protein TonB
MAAHWRRTSRPIAAPAGTVASSTMSAQFATIGDPTGARLRGVVFWRRALAPQRLSSPPGFLAVLRLTLFVVVSTGAHAAALLIPAGPVRPVRPVAAVALASAPAAPEDTREIDLLASTDASEPLELAGGPQPALAIIDSSPRPRQVPQAVSPEDTRVHLAALIPHAAPLASVSPAPTEASPHDETDDAPPIAIGASRAPSNAPPAAAASATVDVAAPGNAPLPATSVDGRARLLRGVAPAYPAKARADGVEGTVGLELVVDASGSLESARVVRGAGHGLDEAALAAAKEFRFTPATKGGRAVRVRMGWSIDFRFRD